jgi:activator of 2-hydroxyglutaryl-CoA dehydratase
MITAGVDVGGKVIKAVLLRDGQILSKVAIPASHDRREAATEAVEEAAKQAGITWEQIERMTSTGAGSRRATFAAEKLTVIGAIARGAAWLFPSAGMVMDVGAEEGRVVKYNAEAFPFRLRLLRGLGRARET